MARDHDIVYPAKGRITFDGGVNSKFERSIIPDNESPSCFNVVFSNGAVETRSGSSKLNTTAVGSFVGDGIYTRRANDGSETMIVFAGGTAWALTGASTFSTIASAQSVFTAGVRVGTAQYENHIFVGNGGVTPYKWNGVAWTRHGVPQATGAVTVASQAVGVLTGQYNYKIAYLNSQSVLGDVGTATVTFNAAGATLRLTGIPTAPQSHGVSARRIYRTEAGGTTYKQLTTINDNTTTTYDDNTADASLGATAPTDQGEPPKYSVIAQHQNRLFCNDAANPNYIWYSEALEPYTFKTTNFLPIGDASFDLIKGIDVYDNSVVVRCERASYMIYMPSTDPSDWRTIKIRSPYGSRSPFGSFPYNNKLMYPAMESGKFVGFAAIGGSTIDPDSTSLDFSRAGSDLKSNRIEPDMFEVQEAYVGNISAQVFKNKAYIAVTSGDGTTTNNRIWVYDFSISNLKKQEASWVPISGLAAAQFTVYDGKLYYVSSTATGFVYRLETTTYNDNSAAIDSYFWTKEFSGLKGHETYEKDFRFANILVELVGSYFMKLNIRVDSDTGEGTSKTISLDPGGTTWGSFNWGAANWDAGRGQRDVRVPLGPARGKRIQFRFGNQNAVNQAFKVHSMQFTYNLKGKR